MRLLARCALLASLSVLLGAACSGASIPPADLAVDADSAVDGLPADLGKAAQVCGALEDARQNRAIAGLTITFAQSGTLAQSAIMASTRSDGSGAFCLAVHESGDFVLRVVEGKAFGDRSAELILPLTVVEQAIELEMRLDLGALVVPLLSLTVSYDPTTAIPAGYAGEIGDGVFVNIPAGAITQPPLGLPFGLAAQRLTPGQVHAQLLASGPGARAAALALVLMPSTLRFSQPFEFALPNHSTLAVGTKLEIYRASATTGRLAPDGRAVVNSAKQVQATGATGPTGFGWLLLYPEAP